MDVTLTPELEKRIREKIDRGEYENADALVQQALDWFLDVDDEDELTETNAAIERARAESDRGEAVPADQVFEELRAKYGIPR
jgi:Arc/MetJ-type ribon-helix-helix transcriptional regulator